MSPRPSLLRPSISKSCDNTKTDSDRFVGGAFLSPTEITLIVMLGPFRIRNLRRPGSPSNSRSPGNPSKLGYHDAVVCLTGSEYHKNALRNPESRLKYLDETDGEIVTVRVLLTCVRVSSMLTIYFDRWEPPWSFRNDFKSLYHAML